MLGSSDRESDVSRHVKDQLGASGFRAYGAGVDRSGDIDFLHAIFSGGQEYFTNLWGEREYLDITFVDKVDRFAKASGNPIRALEDLGELLSAAADRVPPSSTVVAELKEHPAWSPDEPFFNVWKAVRDTIETDRFRGTFGWSSSELAQGTAYFARSQLNESSRPEENGLVVARLGEALDNAAAALGRAMLLGVDAEDAIAVGSFSRSIDFLLREIAGEDVSRPTFAAGGDTKLMAMIEDHQITSAALVEQKRAGEFAVSSLESNELVAALSSPSFEPAFDFNIVSNGRSVRIDDRIERFEGVPIGKAAAQSVEFGLGNGPAETDRGLDIDL